MQTLTLRIENIATFQDMGATFLRLSGTSVQVGRKAAMDWTLPDPSRHISGHHFDVSYEGSAYILYDVSKNGTFLHGDRHRLAKPRVLQQGDKFSVGAYTIGVELSDTEGAAPPPPAASDLITRRPVAPVEEVKPDRVADQPVVHAAEAIQTPGPGPRSEQVAAVPQRPDLRSFAKTPPPENVSPPPQFRQASAASVLVQAPSKQPAAADDPVALSPPSPLPSPSPSPRPVAAAVSPVSANEPKPAQPETPQPEAPAHADGDLAEQQFLQAFLDGAGVTDPDQLRLPAPELGRLLGRCVQEATEEMMHMLQNRAAVKLFMSGQDRTMRLANGNNPMKFMLETDRAFEAMFLAPRDGYMDGADGFKNALVDIRNHQDAVVAALQPALAEMLDGLSPDEIEKTAGKGLFGGKSRKFWKEYKTRWTARASQGENGMLDAFISAFSRHYADALRKKQM